MRAHPLQLRLNDAHRGAGSADRQLSGRQVIMVLLDARVAAFAPHVPAGCPLTPRRASAAPGIVWHGGWHKPRTDC